MSENIGTFKVVIEGEVDKKLGDSLEKGFKQNFAKVGTNLEKEIEKAIDKSITNAKKFEKAFKIPSMGEIGAKLESFIGDSFKKIGSKFGSKILSPTPKIESGSIEKDVAAGASEGAAVGGAKGAAAGGIIALVSKLSIAITAIMLVVDAIKSLAPIQAILKMITAVLQITLYPIAQFFLSIFKPILIMLLKYLILPFYYNVMPILEKLGSFIGEGVGNIAGWIFLTFLEPIYNNIVAMFKLVTTIFTSIVTIISAAFKVVFNLIMNLGNFIITTWTSVFKSIYSMFVFFGKLISGLVALLFGPLIEAMAEAAQGPEHFGKAIQHLLGWVTGAKDRFTIFSAAMGNAWGELITEIDLNAEAIIMAGSQVFVSLVVDILNFADTAVSAVKNILIGIVEVAATMSESAKTVMLGLADGIGKIFLGISKSVINILNMMGIKINIDLEKIGTDFGDIVTNFKEMFDEMKGAKFSDITAAFNKMIDDLISKMSSTVLPTPTPPDTGGGGGGGGCTGDTCFVCFTESCSSDTNTGCGNDTSCLTDGLGNCDYTGMARGGIVTGPTRALIGEAGPEAVIPLPGFLSGGGLGDLVRGNVSTNTKLNSENIGGTTIHNTFNIARIEKEVDIDDIVSKIERTFYTNTKRAGIR